MIHFRRSLVLLRRFAVIMILFTSVVWAQEPVKLSLDSAIQVAVENNKTLKISRFAAEAADAQSRTANTALLPTLTAGASYTRLSEVPAFTVTTPFPAPLNQITLSDPILDNYSARATLQQPIFVGGKLKAAADAQSAVARAARADVETSRTELVYRTQQTYWQVYKAREFKSVIDDNISTVEAHLNDVRNLQAQGMATKSDVLAVEVQLSNARLNQIDAADNIRLATLSLANLIGLPLESPIEITTAPERMDSIAPLPQYQDSTSLTRRALELRPEVKAAKRRIEASEAGIKVARASWYPAINAFAVYYYQNPNQRYQPLVDEWNDSWDVGVGATWSIWNWGATRHQIRQARAQFDQAQTAHAALQDAVQLEVAADLLKLNESREKVAVSFEGAELAVENHRSVLERFKNGLASNSELLDAEDDLLRARWNHTQSLVDHQIAIAKLQKTIAE